MLAQIRTVKGLAMASKRLLLWLAALFCAGCCCLGDGGIDRGYIEIIGTPHSEGAGNGI
jgi:hypothetical protein